MTLRTTADLFHGKVLLPLPALHTERTPAGPEGQGGRLPAQDGSAFRPVEGPRIQSVPPAFWHWSCLPMLAAYGR